MSITMRIIQQFDITQEEEFMEIEKRFYCQRSEGCSLVVLV